MMKRPNDGEMAQLRMKVGLTQEMAAQRIGIDRTTITKWETGKNYPKRGMIKKIAKVYQCEIEDVYDALEKMETA